MRREAGQRTTLPAVLCAAQRPGRVEAARRRRCREGKRGCNSVEQAAAPSLTMSAACCHPHLAQEPTLGRDIPGPAKRLGLAEGVALPPGDYSTTPGGTVFGTTPGGTRIIYDRKFLMACRNSPVAKTPPCNLPDIPGVTSPGMDELQMETRLIHAADEKTGLGEEAQFDMDI